MDAPGGGVVKRDYSGVWILVATILGSSMAFIDGTAVNVALPIMQDDFGASLADLQWVISGYGLFLASLLLVAGALGDRLGRRRTFIWGIAVFAGASVWAGFAPNVEQLIVARAVQGIGGALFIPGSLALIGACFTDKERGPALGTWAAASGLTSAAGPLLGGFLAETLSWRWVFFINIPIAVIVIAIAIMRVPESRDDTAEGRIDYLGGLLATLGLGGIVYGLIASANDGFSDPVVITTLAGGVFGMIAFIVTEIKVAHPMMPLGVFKSRSFSGANFLTLLLYSGLGGAIFFLPLNLVQVQGYSATEAGAAMLPFLLSIGFLSRYTGGLVTRIGAKWPLAAGTAITGLGFVLFALTEMEDSYWTSFFPAVTAFGLGMALTIAPLVTVVMGTVDPRLSGLASGINNAVTRTGFLMAVAVFGIVALAFFSSSLDERLDDIGASPAVVEFLDDERLKLAGAELPPGLSAADSAAVQGAIDGAFVEAFQNVMWIAAAMAFLSALVALVAIEGRPKPPSTA
jgi:EmrB/QacA subfamily drug resistance transporter